MRRLVVFLSPILVLAGFLGSSAAIAEERVLPEIGKRAIYSLAACESPTELDCVDSFGIIEEVEGVRTEILGSQIEFDYSLREKSQTGSTIYGGLSKWTIPLASGAIEVPLRVHLESTKNIIDPVRGHTGASFFIRVDSPEDDLETKYFLRLRTSWFKPENFTMAAAKAEFSETKIPGGKLWYFAGSRVKMASYKFENREQYAKAMAEGGPADWESTNLHFIGHHVRTNANRPSSYFDNPCSHQGYMVQANNAPGGGMAYWNHETKSLEFSIEAAHRSKDGKLNRGFYRMWVNKDYVRCMWPTSGLDKAKSFAIGVYNEDGQKQVATTLVATKGDLFTVAAFNFHYSAPTIRVSGSKKKILTCVGVADESQVKKFKSKRICPNGYKKFG